MFFRKVKPRRPAFPEVLAAAEESGFLLRPRDGSGSIAIRGRCAAQIGQTTEDGIRIEHAGITVGAEIAKLVHRGYQTVWRWPSRAEEAARADQLADLHEFLEDLRAALGIPSLYNESLGTVNAIHDYDRLAERN